MPAANSRPNHPQILGNPLKGLWLLADPRVFKASAGLQRSSIFATKRERIGPGTLTTRRISKAWKAYRW
eukprot:scaffold8097_cov258-Pinguiococcus_pyrenoidosus.AAC.4